MILACGKQAQMKCNSKNECYSGICENGYCTNNGTEDSNSKTGNGKELKMIILIFGGFIILLLVILVFVCKGKVRILFS